MHNVIAKKSSLTLDEDANLGSFGLKINSTAYAIYINGTQNMGVGTNALANKLSLKCAAGDGIRMTDSISNGYGNNSLNLLRTVLTLSSAGTQQLQLTLLLITNSIDSYLTAAASTTSYSIAIIGVRL